MVSADIFIGAFNGNATGIASTRRIVSGPWFFAGNTARPVFSSINASRPRWSPDNHIKKADESGTNNPAARSKAATSTTLVPAFDERL
jgi:hypothetical protein